MPRVIVDSVGETETYYFNTKIEADNFLSALCTEWTLCTDNQYIVENGVLLDPTKRSKANARMY